LASVDEIRNPGIVLDEKEKKILFNKEFMAALSSNPINYIGNYASVDIGASKASFATSFVRDGSVFGLNVSGGTSDKTLNFIKNNKVNYNLDVGFQYHFIDASKKIRFEIDVENLELMRLKRKNILLDAEKKIIGTKKKKNIKGLQTQKASLEAQISVLDKKVEYIDVLSLEIGDKQPKSMDKEALRLKIVALEMKFKQYEDYKNYLLNPNDSAAPYLKSKLEALKKVENCFSDACIAKKINLQNDTDAKKIQMYEKEVSKELIALKTNYNDYDISKQKEKLISSKLALKKELKILEEEIELVQKENEFHNNNEIFLESIERTKKQQALKAHDKIGVRSYGATFSWFSIGFKTSLKSFTLYDSQVPFEDQLNQKKAANSELTLQYSWHSQNELKSWKSYLINTGASITYGDNSALLTPLTLEDQTDVVTNGTITRSTKDQTNVLVGQYDKDIAGARLFTDMYYFLFKDNFAALHFYPTATFTQLQKPLFAVEIGVLLSFKDSKNNEAVVNAEVFYSLNDLGNKFNSDLNVLGRNTIGLRLTVPIKFKY
tara:strand:+ start:256 stop:1899 length:1644 start_codon:yes stop_codon:yes gene_type:complete